MTQLSLVKKYHENGLTAIQIYNILKEIFEDDAMPYSTISYHIRRDSWLGFDNPNKNLGGRPANYQKDKLILMELNDDPTKSCRQIAQCIGYATSSVHYVLTVRMGYKTYNIQWVPYVLTTLQKQERVADSRDLIEVLTKASKHN